MIENTKTLLLLFTGEMIATTIKTCVITATIYYTLSLIGGLEIILRLLH